MKKIVLLLLLSVLTGCGINNLPTYDEGVNAAWSGMQNQYKRRADLISMLVKVVQASADYERGVLLDVVEARSKATQVQLPDNILSDPQAFQQFQASQDQLSSALSKLLVVVESYPDLKTNKNFLDLQLQIEGTENRIGVARRDYIKAVQQYNTELRTYPGKLWHRFLYSELEPKQNFSAPPEAQQTPEINFN